MVTLIGFRKFVSKDGKACCIVNCLEDFSLNDCQHGACGQCSKEYFLNAEYHSLILPSAIGKKCEYVFGFNDFGKPAVVGLNFLEDKK